ncbi:beta-ketoacyl-ACP synthase III [Candidatus Hydrogenosomobacter endosymbioticus]|uniref:Beta-ketoacyl-[acyl-carrier-protein] synthase III n=1 Tax=Candidatus Hydrogenosomobacter endosymbioticus TaxID=2558174 RepID=A0ABM7V912_9PROT|nr:beta-ketoacyl-ACP synthase III [Candidatus Hydrogenosomobacter endosymbioticus]BDB96255.1 3-oxoacyl-[acyl-carrier-protein] synthase 3 [Candidatus Hydrogenosomobacter endosymbioticus]
MCSCVICGIGGYLPSNVVTNDMLSLTLDTSDQWISERTGIKERRIISDEESTSDMACSAAEVAIEDAGVSAEDIDLIIVATSTADNTFPAAATKVQKKLGAFGAIAFDLNAACSGFLFALDVARSYIKLGNIKTALVIGADSLSKVVDWSDRSTAVLFGDGAGAFLLRAGHSSENSLKGVIASRLYTNGRGYGFLYVSGGPGTTRTSGTIKMSGREVFKEAVTQMEKLCFAVLDDAGIDMSGVDIIVPHQANKRIIDLLAQRFDAKDKMVCSIASHSNTCAASVPLALWSNYGGALALSGKTVLFVAFGAGFTAGACVAKF